MQPDCLQARNEEALCFKHLYGEWEQKHGCKVITSTRDTFEEMFDNDDTLTYEPSSTAAIILTGNDEEGEEAEKAAAEVGGCFRDACMRRQLCLCMGVTGGRGCCIWTEGIMQQAAC